MGEESDPIFIVSIIDGTELLDTRAFAKEEKAEKFYAEKSKKYFGDRFDEARDKFPEDATYEDYQFSEIWWDSGATLFITFSAAWIE